MRREPKKINKYKIQNKLTVSGIGSDLKKGFSLSSKKSSPNACRTNIHNVQHTMPLPITQKDTR